MFRHTWNKFLPQSSGRTIVGKILFIYFLECSHTEKLKFSPRKVKEANEFSCLVKKFTLKFALSGHIQRAKVLCKMSVQPKRLTSQFWISRQNFICTYYVQLLPGQWHKRLCWAGLTKSPQSCIIWRQFSHSMKRPRYFSPSLKTEKKASFSIKVTFQEDRRKVFGRIALSKSDSL